jgi:hypothetical protein
VSSCLLFRGAPATQLLRLLKRGPSPLHPPSLQRTGGNVLGGAFRPSSRTRRRREQGLTLKARDDRRRFALWTYAAADIPEYEYQLNSGLW